MTTMLAGLTSDESINNETDSVGGSGPVESGLYSSTIGMAYVITSKKGATGIVLSLKSSGRTINETVYVTSGTAKGAKNYYEKDGEKHYLPGFNLMNSLSLLSVGKELSELVPEEKVVSVWNYDAKAEVPTKVMVLTELLDKPIVAGVQKMIVDKKTLGDDGAYHNTGETREVNQIDKFFRAGDNLTTAEIRAGIEEAVFFQTWSDKNTGVTRDTSNKETKTGTGAPGAFGAAPVPTAKPVQKLFGQ